MSPLGHAGPYQQEAATPMNRISKGHRVAWVAGAVALAAVLGLFSTARAQEGIPVDWSFVDQTVTNGGEVHWTSPTNVDPGFLYYDYIFEITKVEAQLGIWLDVTSEIPPEDRVGAGTLDGPPPVVIFDDSFSESGELYGTPYVIAADLSAWVDEFGYGHLDVTNVVLDPVTAARLSGNVSVTPRVPIPEPTAIGLLLSGIVGLVGCGRLGRRRFVA